MAIEILDFLDLALIGNLLLVVIFLGYENFVSKIGSAKDYEDCPSWMGELDFSGLKIKIVGLIVVISLIGLFRDFLMAADGVGPNIEFWRVSLHLVFVISGVLFSLMNHVSEREHS